MEASPWPVLAGLLGALVSACTGSANFVCSDDNQCTGASQCFAPGYCGVASDECPSGWAYGQGAPGELQGECVQEDAGTGTDTAASTSDDLPMSSTSSSESGTSTGNVVPETSTSGTDPTTGMPTGTGTTGELLDPDLLAWYRFDEDDDVAAAVDSSGNGYDATCVGICPSRIEGVYGLALLASGDGFLQVDAIEDFALPQITIAAWIRDDSGNDDLSGMIVGRAYGSRNDNSYQLLTRVDEAGSGRELAWLIDNGGSPDQILTFAIPELAGNWVHVAGTWDGEVMTLHVDGAPVGSLPAPTMPYDDHPLTLAGDLNAGSPANRWVGAIDDLRIYARALTDEEIAELATR